MRDHLTAKAREGKPSYIKGVVSKLLCNRYDSPGTCILHVHVSCPPQSSHLRWTVYGKRESGRQNFHCLSKLSLVVIIINWTQRWNFLCPGKLQFFQLSLYAARVMALKSKTSALLVVALWVFYSYPVLGRPSTGFPRKDAGVREAIQWTY